MGKAFPAIIVAALCLSPAYAQTKLEWQLKKGETFVALRIYTQKQSVTFKGKVLKAERQKTWVSSITVKDKTPAGYVLDVRFDKAEFHSAGDRAVAAPTLESFDQRLAAKLNGSSFSAMVTGNGKVAKLLGYDAFIRKLAESEAGPEKTLRSVLSEETLRDDLEEIFQLFPDKPVRAGDPWKRDTSEPVPPFGFVQSSIEYSLTGDGADEVEIGFKIKVAFKPPAGDGDLFRVVKGAVTADPAKGTITFDVKQGRLVRAEKALTIRGELVIDSMGSQTGLEFTSENTLQVRIYGKMENMGSKKD